MNESFLKAHNFEVISSSFFNEPLPIFNPWDWKGALCLSWKIPLDIGSPAPTKDGIIWGDDDGIEMMKKCKQSIGYIALLYRNGRFTVKASNSNLKAMGKRYVAKLKAIFKGDK